MGPWNVDKKCRCLAWVIWLSLIATTLLYLIYNLYAIVRGHGSPPTVTAENSVWGKIPDFAICESPPFRCSAANKPLFIRAGMYLGDVDKDLGTRFIKERTLVDPRYSEWPRPMSCLTFNFSSFSREDSMFSQTGVDMLVAVQRSCEAGYRAPMAMAALYSVDTGPDVTEKTWALVTDFQGNEWVTLATYKHVDGWQLGYRRIAAWLTQDAAWMAAWRDNVSLNFALSSRISINASKFFRGRTYETRGGLISMAQKYMKGLEGVPFDNPGLRGKQNDSQAYSPEKAYYFRLSLHFVKPTVTTVHKLGLVPQILDLVSRLGGYLSVVTGVFGFFFAQKYINSDVVRTSNILTWTCCRKLPDDRVPLLEDESRTSERELFLFECESFQNDGEASADDEPPVSSDDEPSAHGKACCL